MSIELEVGQVWVDKSGRFNGEILKLHEDYVFVYSERCDNPNHYKSAVFTRDDFVEAHKTLITTADGKPHVAPNDYQDGDVWEFLGAGYSYAVLIIKHDGEIKFTEASRAGRPYTVAQSILISSPQDYRLIYRDGEVTAND